MNKIVLLEWKFTPPNYFEQTLDITGGSYSMSITKGKVEARIDSAIYDANPSMRKELQDKLNCSFLVVQMLTYQAYELSCLSISRLYPEGRKDAVIEPEIFQNKNTFSVQILDLQIKMVMSFPIQNRNESRRRRSLQN